LSHRLTGHMEDEMHSGLRLIALSTALAVSAGSAVAAEVPCSATTDKVTHRESTFHLGAISPKWRVALTAPNVVANPTPTTPKEICNQALYAFLPLGASNKSGNDFVGELAGTPKPVPGCDSPHLYGTEHLVDGQIEVYCSTINNNQTKRWLSVVVHAKAGGGEYYGAAYAVIESNTLSNNKPAFTGVGIDPFNDQTVRINIIAEQ
jgi:hypothetical protein